jgi:hypothetical protein
MSLMLRPLKIMVALPAKAAIGTAASLVPDSIVTACELMLPGRCPGRAVKEIFRS